MLITLRSIFLGVDDTDRRILLYLFRDGRISLHRISKVTRIDYSTIKYRFKYLRERGILRGFQLYVNPAFFGLRRVFLLSSESIPRLANMAIEFRCIEGPTLYEFACGSKQELNDLCSKYQNTILECWLPSRIRSEKISRFDYEIIKALNSDPRAPNPVIAKVLKVPTKQVKKHIEFLYSNNYIRVFPDTQIDGSSLPMFTLISMRPLHVRSLLLNNLVWEYRDKKKGFSCAAPMVYRV
ncbi:hypothetical protein B9Q11_02445 [Candidatus Marsarchaeota G2 archaeon ECH_B_SAG-F08]|uniref:HTH asnC-type domain-containing protein n=2 Tax=Candidatus Marsarchaeota group 2 TaxID=2203771 RepID=A0A2R6BI78_9ARCH|nr:MAG: hypothetical protein B9Q11_02445 [Candidatus Marsarchaeota G2 archaeon ECH_B_SAG-F08]PSO05692.1 MAG: hypothetical protein B9Q13_01300 [Candidatus Marsarchaeota G2 archaeon ECH_B_SAG-G16]